MRAVSPWAVWNQELVVPERSADLMGRLMQRGCLDRRRILPDLSGTQQRDPTHLIKCWWAVPVCRGSDFDCHVPGFVNSPAARQQRLWRQPFHVRTKKIQAGETFRARLFGVG